MRINRLIIETKKVDLNTENFEVSLETSDSVLSKTSVFIFQKVESGANSISAKNLVVSNISNSSGPIKFNALLSGDKSADHLSEVNLIVDTLLIAEGK